MAKDRIDASIEKNSKNVSQGGQMAIVLCTEAFASGGNWGFLPRSRADFSAVIETLKEEHGNVSLIRVSNGAIVVAKEAFLGQSVNALVPNALGMAFVEKAKQRRAEEQERFAKFIKSVTSGKSKYVKKAEGYYELTLGVFCVNETNLIRLNGVDYPAYKLSLVEALSHIHEVLQREGRTLYVRAIKEDSSPVYGKVTDFMNTKGLAALYRAVEISDTNTGAFVTIRIA